MSAAGFAANWGLSKGEALRTVTLNAAKVIGMERTLGSLTPGKQADIVLTDGDLFEATTQILQIWIDGQDVDLGNRQSDLYDRYRERLHKIRAK